MRELIHGFVDEPLPIPVSLLPEINFKARTYYVETRGENPQNGLSDYPLTTFNGLFNLADSNWLDAFSEFPEDFFKGWNSNDISYQKTQ